MMITYCSNCGCLYYGRNVGSRCWACKSENSLVAIDKKEMTKNEDCNCCAADEDFEITAAGVKICSECRKRR